jgi:hypothetical protein
MVKFDTLKSKDSVHGKVVAMVAIVIIEGTVTVAATVTIVTTV